MNNLGSRVTDVNQVAEQLLSSDSCNKDKIHQTRDQLNNRSERIKTILHGNPFSLIALIVLMNKPLFFLIWCGTQMERV